MSVSVLHLGQYNGKCSKTVSFFTLTRVFPWQTGQRTQKDLLSGNLYSSLFFSLCIYVAGSKNSKLFSNSFALFIPYQKTATIFCSPFFTTLPSFLYRSAALHRFLLPLHLHQGSQLHTATVHAFCLVVTIQLSCPSCEKHR